MDFILIRNMRSGDDEAFDAFIHKYYSDILLYCIYHCSDKENAKDLTQETFIRFQDFLWTQLKLIKKKWWIMQFILLIILSYILKVEESTRELHRSLGVASSLFVILIIPELWKNQANNSLEIECTAYYSLKQIYASRLIIFGVVDVSLLTIFFLTSSVFLDFPIVSFMVYFLFPLCMTTIICLIILSSKRHVSETTTVISCLFWSVIWLSIILNDIVFKIITLPVWILLLSFSIIFIGLLIRNVLNHTNHFWEVSPNGINR